MNLPVNPDITRFQKYVEKGEGECHRWKGGKDIKGYGIFFFKGKTWFAHRASLILYDRIKSLNPALQIRHSCKNKDCVNPDHLSEGTREENCADKRRDGTNLSGDKCHFSKLNWENQKIRGGKLVLGKLLLQVNFCQIRFAALPIPLTNFHP